MQKTLMNHSWGKCQTDRPTEEQTDRWSDNSDFIGPSKGQGSQNIKCLLTRNFIIQPFKI